METISLILQAADLTIKWSQRGEPTPLNPELDRKLSAISSELSSMLDKQDQSITREIYSGFEAIRDAVTTENPETQSNYLGFAEQSLLRNTALNRSLATDGKPNQYWIGLAHYGLALICAIREDERIAVRHVIRMFREDPRTARNLYVPKVYETLFASECQDLRDLNVRVHEVITRGLLHWQLEHGLAAIQQDCPANLVDINVYRAEIGPGAPSYRVVLSASRNELDEALEKTIDTRCIVIAQRYLREV